VILEAIPLRVNDDTIDLLYERIAIFDSHWTDTEVSSLASDATVKTKLVLMSCEYNFRFQVFLFIIRILDLELWQESWWL
jgi:hypothetical protein